MIVAIRDVAVTVGYFVTRALNATSVSTSYFSRHPPHSRHLTADHLGRTSPPLFLLAIKRAFPSPGDLFVRISSAIDTVFPTIPVVSATSKYFLITSLHRPETSSFTLLPYSLIPPPINISTRPVLYLSSPLLSNFLRRWNPPITPNTRRHLSPLRPWILCFSSKPYYITYNPNTRTSPLYPRPRRRPFTIVYRNRTLYIPFNTYRSLILYLRAPLSILLLAGTLSRTDTILFANSAYTHTHTRPVHPQ